MFSFGNMLEAFRSRKFLDKNLSQVKTLNLDTIKNSALHIFTITYNNELLLNHQIRLMRKNIKDNFSFIVADNSSDPLKRQKIETFCRENNIPYISLPKNPFKTSSSSHGICLNWLYKNCISEFKPGYFGFIDHDIYPVEQHSLINYLETQNVYGQHQGTDKFWFLWAGLCFFKYNFIKGKELNFLPSSINGVHVDTGGANWDRLYSKLDKSKLKFPSHAYIDLRKGDVIQSDKMERIGEWLHSFNGSGWMEIDPKDNILNDYLEKL